MNADTHEELALNLMLNKKTSNLVCEQIFDKFLGKVPSTSSASTFIKHLKLPTASSPEYPDELKHMRSLHYRLMLLTGKNGAEFSAKSDKKEKYKVCYEYCSRFTL